MLQPDLYLQQVIKNKGAAVILGFGTTGVAAATFCLNEGLKVFVIEKQSIERFYQIAKNVKAVQELQKQGVQFSFSDQVSDEIKKIDPTNAIGIISPGMPMTSMVAEKIRSLKIPLIGELELGLALTKVPSVIVTGSNGKSTCVTIIDAMLRASNKATFLCGNIGHTVIALLDKKAKIMPLDSLVVEASSYQLESAQTIRPKVAVILNLSENHLERHGTMESYLEAKMRVTKNQTIDDFVVLNADDPRVFAVRRSVVNQLALFGKSVNSGDAETIARIEYAPAKGIDRIQIESKAIGSHVFDCTKSKLIGEHARYNIAASALAALLMGASAKGVNEVINNFVGLEHRLQRVDTASGFFAINDSKSTTVASAVAALSSVHRAYPTQPIHMLVGGKVKLGSWKPLAEIIRQIGEQVRVTCFGGDGLFIQQELAQFGVICHLAKNVAMATTYGCDWMRKDEILLFSPGCASFDEFSNFEERGRFFAKLVELR